MNEYQEWISDNMGYIRELVYPILQERQKALSEYDCLFYDDIDKQCLEMVLSKIADEMCKAKACSAEEFYANVSTEQLGEIWKLIYLELE